MKRKVFLSPMLKEKEKNECMTVFQRKYPDVTYADKITEADLRIAAKDEIPFIIKTSIKIITPLALSQMCVYRVNPFENDIPVNKIVNLFLYGYILVFVDCSLDKTRSLTRKILSMGGVIENIINFNGDQKDENTYFLYSRPLTQAEVKAERKNVHTDWIDTLYVSDCNINYENFKIKTKRATAAKNMSVRSATKAASKDKNGILKYRVSMNQPDILTAFSSTQDFDEGLAKDSTTQKMTTESTAPKCVPKKHEIKKQKPKDTGEPVSVFRLPNTDTQNIDHFFSSPIRSTIMPHSKDSPPVANAETLHSDPNQTIGFISISDSSSSDEDISELLQKNSFEAITARVSQQTVQSEMKYSTPRRTYETIDLTQVSDDSDDGKSERHVSSTFSPVYKSPLQSPKRSKLMTQNSDDKLKQLVSSLLTIHPIDKPAIQQHKHATSSTMSDITQFTQISDFSQSQNEEITYESESRSASQFENFSPNHDPLLQALSSFV